MKFVNRRSFFASLVVGVLTLAACTSPAPTPTPTATPRPTATPTPTATAVPPSPTPTSTAIQGTGIQGGDPDFDFSAMVWQGYWLSRDHFGPFVMASGMGVPFMPDMDMMQMAMQMVAQNPNDPVMMPQNMMPLQAVYKSGSPGLLNNPMDFNAMDFQGMRLNPASFDVTVGVRGQAETMLKESQWARNFANPHFGTPDGGFGAQQRFTGMMVNMLAQMQAQYAMMNLLNMDDGLYYDSDGNLDYTANWVMLHALSDIAGLAGDMNGRYMNPDMHPMFENAATMLFNALKDRTPASPQEAAAAVRALAFRAWTATDEAVRSAALTKLETIADAQESEGVSADVVGNAARIVALIAAAEATGETSYQDAADQLLQRLQTDFDAQHGVLTSKDTYNVDEVAWILGGLNSLVMKGSSAARDDAKAVMLAFYEATISVAGMQLAAPPGKDGAMAGEWEKNLPSVLYYHPANTPPPPMAGKLTVPAEEIRWNGNSWEVTSDRFVTGGAMHLANELNWFGPHLGSLPFPPLRRGA